MRIFHSLSIYLLVYIIDKILIEKFIEGKEIKMFMIFANELAEWISKVKSYLSLNIGYFMKYKEVKNAENRNCK